ncbi:MAG: hypothetical protein J5764_06255 [Bacteroidales bacterium]|nr:hypothetical protein [Bacteroidales bacterium]
MTELPVSVRLNPFKGCDGPEGAAVPWSPYGRTLPSRPVFTLDPLFHAGCYYVQDASAMYVGHLFRKLIQRFDAPVRVLDLCAAPGGKTTDAAVSLRERFGHEFLLVANELQRKRASVLADNVAIWGDPAVRVSSADPAAFAPLKGFFDIIIADVPCSGEGMFRKDPRAEKEWSPELVKLCAARQKRILADVWPALRPGGVLLYSTCTYSREENDDNLEWAARTLGGEIIPPEDEFGLRRTDFGHLLKAGEVQGEGQWAGALVKNGVAASHAAGEVKIPGQMTRLSRGEQKGKDFIPNPDYVLSYDYQGEYPSVELALRDALRFLHRDSFPLEAAAKGYNVVCYKGHPLGIVKNLGSRCNNLHPLSRRILMNIPAEL